VRDDSKILRCTQDDMMPDDGGLGTCPTKTAGFFAFAFAEASAFAKATVDRSADKLIRMTPGGAQRPRPTRGCTTMGFAQFKGGGISSPFEDPPPASGGRGPPAVQLGQEGGWWSEK